MYLGCNPQKIFYLDNLLILLASEANQNLY